MTSLVVRLFSLRAGISWTLVESDNSVEGGSSTFTKAAGIVETVPNMNERKKIRGSDGGGARHVPQVSISYVHCVDETSVRTFSATCSRAKF